MSCWQWIAAAAMPAVVFPASFGIAAAQTTPTPSVLPGTNVASPTVGQARARSSEDAVAAAEDAFGVSIGREQLGIYETDDVRGFSPVAAGNTRIQGLYFDPVRSPGDRIAEETTIRVGIAAQGYPFIAPTGIVDYSLRLPDAARSASVLASGDSWGSGSIEADGTLPLGTPRLVVGGGAFVGHAAYGDGSAQTAANGGVLLRWRPGPALDAVAFASRDRYADGTPGQTYVVDGPMLPRIPRRYALRGAGWLDNRGGGTVSGLVARVALPGSLELKAGLFRSTARSDTDYLLTRSDLGPDGSFDQSVIAAPPSRAGSTSGELRLVRHIGAHAAGHNIYLAFWSRDRRVTFGGGDEVDLGRSQLGAQVDAPRPAFEFGALSTNAIRQRTAGIGYEGRIVPPLQLGVALVRTWYRKTAERPGLAPVVSRASPLLLTTTSTLQLARGLAAYASYAEGLEESAAAPRTAANRGEPVAATRTSQVDGGVRWAVTDRLTVIAGAFRLKKPYFDLDSTNRYVRLGEVVNRGIELSLTGKVTTRLSVVLGAVLQQPRATGEAVALGAIGRRPVGLPDRYSTANLRWQQPWVPRLSFDLALRSLGPTPATTDNRVTIPARSVADLGARYRFTLDGKQAVLRMIVANVGNVVELWSEGSGAYSVDAGRRLSAYVTVDL